MKPRAGLATVMAIVLIGFTAIALASIASLVSYDARRTRETRQGAQLRQLLLAAANAAPTGQQIALPKSMDGKLTLTETPQTDAATRVVRIDAEFNGRRMSQKLRLEKKGEQWVMTEAHLNE